MKDRLKKEQPIVYQTLKNCLKQNRLSHALLFSGPKGTPKLQTALFLAQSLVCEKHQGFACEECDSCRRVAQATYADVIMLDGSQKSIKKEDILNVQHEFNKTALEADGHKIYILNRAENATPEALNSLLKFLEEPSGESTIAILVVEEMDRLLPTIISRCQILPFRPLDQESCCQKAQQQGVSEEDSFLLSHFIKDAEAIAQTAQKETYQKALAGVRYLLSHLLQMEEALIWLQSEVFNDRETMKETLLLFIDLLSAILQDTAKQSDCSIVWIRQEMARIRSLQIDQSRWLLILLSTRDKCSRPFHMGLLLDQMILEMKEVLG